MLSSARSFSKQVLGHRQQIQQQTKTQLRNQQHGQHNSATRPKDQLHDDDAPASMLDKMRQENRERKKRWREVNGERNKDNDLRCRVNKRANQLYGMQSSEAKARWIVEEFDRRQQRRKDKETRKRSPSREAENMAKCARKEGDEDLGAGRQRIPLGFGSYAQMPAHQISAANGFWRCAAGHQALETATTLGENKPTVAAEKPTLPSLANVVTGPAALQTSQHRLPPLSSVVPEQYLSQLARSKNNEKPALASAADENMRLSNPSGHVPFLHQNNNVARQQTLHRHVRPWEDEEDLDDALVCWSPASASSTAAQLPALSPVCRDAELTGLSEAAFSLMSLSSSTSGCDSGCDGLSPASYQPSF
ncbi:hypothetical protein H4R99_005745 [Coemansia sp. RSA 1722]|nr:hypothetical protein LPJ57_003456 [Coemansia sp. RSA 486]KAJ2229029.1 hypothetical protein IWW45_006369 [Coemansia sp. RSA 485]KAJ2594496.1 hypothetical protein H4R99_005745 [Coemansia sp. RSA 1722]KAJ2638505.1 hypothetical protein GGF40_001592 [Coemansia sp. RSA 1286]